MIRFATTLLVLSLFTVSAQAGERWSWELRSGGGPGAGDVAGTDLGAGAGFEALVAYRVQPHLAVYAGWGWHHHGLDSALTEGDLEQTGYSFGLQFVHPVGDGPFGYFVRGGAVARHFELEDDGDIMSDSGHGLGWELGAGLDVGLGGAWSLRPGFTYRSLERDVEIDGVERTVDLSGIDFEIGVARSF